MKPNPHGALAAWRILALAQWREQPVRVLTILLTIALGVALSSSIFLLSSAAADAFGQVTRRLVGEADVIVRGSPTGFAERLYAELAATESVRVASPMLELEVGLAHERGSLKIIGLDPFRAAALQPALLGELSGNVLGLFAANGIYLSAAAARRLGVGRGGQFEVLVGNQPRALKVLGILSSDSYPQPLGIMDIASAQWILDRIGVINRLDLQLVAGTNVERFRENLQHTLPTGLQAIAPDVERTRAASMSRAHRINLNMLALVSLLTGSLLLFATQSLSILRRRTSLGLLRALGVTRRGLQVALFSEGVAIGALGSLLGVALGHALAAMLLGVFSGGFGPGQPAGTDAEILPLQPVVLLAFMAIGTLIASCGAWIPAREAARRAPAQALKAGDAEHSMAAMRPSRYGLALLAAGAALAWLPAVGGVPVFGYLAVAALLFGALLLLPACTVWLLARAPVSGYAPFDIGLAQLRGSVSQITVGLAAIVVSFSLMIAMAIMVYSFRESFERWLQLTLPADIQVRASQGSDTRYLTGAEQSTLSSLPGVAAVEFRRTTQLLLAADRAPVTLIARDLVPTGRVDILQLIEQSPIPAPATMEPVWVSEAMQDLYGYRAGSRITLPLAGRATPLFVAGVFRDYGRTSGAVVMARGYYSENTGDRTATEASLWLRRQGDAQFVTAEIRRRIAAGDALEIRTSTELREAFLRAFDSAFLVTYALEAAAVLIGLVGVAFAGAAAALARRGEFGMLRHIGMLRRQIAAMLAGEGLLVSTLGACYGLALGAALSLVLVYVVNRQSFNWSIDLAVPWWQLGALCGALLFAATIANVVSGRTAFDTSALRAVREDW